VRAETPALQSSHPEVTPASLAFTPASVPDMSTLAIASPPRFARRMSLVGSETFCTAPYIREIERGGQIGRASCRERV